MVYYILKHHILSRSSNAILTLVRKPKVIDERTLSSRYKSNQTSSDTKPDLRKAGRDERPKKIILAACLLVVIYMYPMIFRPLFKSGDSDLSDKQMDQLEQAKALLNQHRPSHMPEWSNPFEPKDK